MYIILFIVLFIILTSGMKSMVSAVFQYGVVEGWTLKKSDRNRIEAFALWFSSVQFARINVVLSAKALHSD